MDAEKLKEVRRLHECWLWNEPNGKRADLRGAYLRGVDLRGADLRRADLQRADLQGVDLQGADLQGADLQGADLQGADLRRADLQGADLRRADLRRAYLQRADLQGADLRGVDLRGAKGFNPFRCTSLLMLIDQPGEIVAYKLINEKGEGSVKGGINYLTSDSWEVVDANTDPNQDCAVGINVADLTWCMREWRPGYRILKVAFTAADIACIPYATDGKFRVRKARRVGEMDLKQIGLVEDKKTKAGADDRGDDPDSSVAAS